MDQKCDPRGRHDDDDEDEEHSIRRAGAKVSEAGLAPVQTLYFCFGTIGFGPTISFTIHDPMNPRTFLSHLGQLDGACREHGEPLSPIAPTQNALPCARLPPHGEPPKQRHPTFVTHHHRHRFAGAFHQVPPVHSSTIRRAGGSLSVVDWMDKRPPFFLLSSSKPPRSDDDDAHAH